MRLSISFTLIVACAMPAMSVGAAAQDAVDQSERVIVETLPRLVKLYGAGGYRGLDAYGTGFLASADGHVVTSWGPLLDADPVIAILDDGRRFDAKLVGADPDAGLAVLKLQTTGESLPYFDLSEAGAAVPGDRVLAFSNMFRVAAGDEPVSVMHGTILAKVPLDARRGRFDVNFDEPVYVIDAVTNNPGAAGGVIVTLDGRITGMIGRELRGEDSETWVNYALPADVVASRTQSILDGTDPLAEQPASTPQPKSVRRPIEFGLVMIPNVTARTPAFIADILDNSAAASAGLQRDDLILFAAKSPVRSIDELTAAFSQAQPGDDLTIVVRRGGRLETVRLSVPR